MATYQSGEPKMKPDVLEQIKVIEAEMAKPVISTCAKSEDINSLLE